MLNLLKNIAENIQSLKEREIEEEKFNGYGFMRRIYGVEEMPAFQTVLKLARTDTLTGTLNRLAFDDMIEREIDVARRYGSRLSLVMLNIDYFSDINKKYNHLNSDELLKDFAKFLKASIRKADILFRWSGDEFLIMMIHTDLQMAQQFVSLITEKILTYNFKSVGKISSSAGFTEVGFDESLDTILMRLQNEYLLAKKRRKKST